MEEALHIASGEKILAAKAEYKDYYGIFLCPRCKEVVHLRKTYTRSDGVKVSAAFVHQVAEENDSCPLRVDISISGSIAVSSNFIDRKQNFELLQKYFVAILDARSRMYSSLTYGEPIRIFPYGKPGTMQEIKVADIKKSGAISYFYFKDKLRREKSFFGKTYQDSISGLKSHLSFWTPLQIERFLLVSSQILSLPQSRWHQISGSISLEFFLKNKDIWKGLSERSILTSISTDELILSHYHRVILVQDFLRLSAGDLTRKLTVCVAIKNILSDFSIRRWLEYKCNSDFLKAAENILINPKLMNDLFQAIQKGKVTPRFEKLEFFFKLIIQALEELIMYTDWGFTLKFIIDSTAN